MSDCQLFAKCLKCEISDNQHVSQRSTRSMQKSGTLTSLPVLSTLVVKNTLQTPRFLYFNLHKFKTILMRLPCPADKHFSFISILILIYMKYSLHLCILAKAVY